MGEKEQLLQEYGNALRDFYTTMAYHGVYYDEGDEKFYITAPSIHNNNKYQRQSYEDGYDYTQYSNYESGGIDNGVHDTPNEKMMLIINNKKNKIQNLANAISDYALANGDFNLLRKAGILPQNVMSELEREGKDNETGSTFPRYEKSIRDIATDRLFANKGYTEDEIRVINGALIGSFIDVNDEYEYEKIRERFKKDFPQFFERAEQTYQKKIAEDEESPLEKTQTLKPEQTTYTPPKEEVKVVPDGEVLGKPNVDRLRKKFEKPIDKNINHKLNADADTSILGNYNQQKGFTNGLQGDNKIVDWDAELQSQLNENKQHIEGNVIPASPKQQVSDVNKSNRDVVNNLSQQDAVSLAKNIGVTQQTTTTPMPKAQSKPASDFVEFKPKAEPIPTELKGMRDVPQITKPSGNMLLNIENPEYKGVNLSSNNNSPVARMDNAVSKPASELKFNTPTKEIPNELNTINKDIPTPTKPTQVDDSEMNEGNEKNDISIGKKYTTTKGNKTPEVSGIEADWNKMIDESLSNPKQVTLDNDGNPISVVHKPFPSKADTKANEDKLRNESISAYNQKQREELAKKNEKFGTYTYDNTAYTPKGTEYIGKTDEELGNDKNAIRKRDKAEAKLAENQRDYEKFMDYVRQYDKYNQYGGAFNYDQFTSSVDPKIIRAAAKALGVKGLSNVGIATEELYNAARKEMQKKYDVAYQERQAIQTEKKKAEDALKDQIKDDAKRNELQEYIYSWSQALSGDPKDFEANQAEFIKGLQQRLDDAGFETRVDGIAEQQTFRRAIEAMAERNPQLKDLFVASGVMMPVGYEKASPLDKWLDGDDKERAEYELRFAQRRDQRNRFAQSLVDLAGITSRMIAASGGAKMEPYKNDMYDKFREDMTAARKRYDERMGEIRQREIDAEKEAYARIREREKAALEQKNADRAYNFQVSRAEAQDKHNADRLALQKQELNDNRAYRNKYLGIEQQKADNYKTAHEQGVKQNIKLGLEKLYDDYIENEEYEKLYDFVLRQNEQYKKEAPDGIYDAKEIANIKNKRDNKIIEDLAKDEADNIEDWGKESWYEREEPHLKEAKEGVSKLVNDLRNKGVDEDLIERFINDKGLSDFYESEKSDSQPQYINGVSRL